MKTFIRTTEIRPYDSVLHCGICGLEIHVTRSEPGWTGAFFSPEEAELRCEQHLTENHGLRFRLWRLLRWRWLIAGLAP